MVLHWLQDPEPSWLGPMPGQACSLHLGNCRCGQAPLVKARRPDATRVFLLRAATQRARRAQLK
eukprot:9588830-Alexandrium_andersonii.AAC.1